MSQCLHCQCLTPVKSRLTGEELSPRMKVLFHCDQDQEEAFNDCIPPRYVFMWVLCYSENSQEYYEHCGLKDFL